MIFSEKKIITEIQKLNYYECLINKNHIVEDYSIILISKIQDNNLFSIAVFKIDSLCLGVVETYYKYNLNIDTYRNIIKDIKIKFAKTNINYISKIIYQACDLAYEIGLKPHLNFAVTQHFLELIISEDAKNVNTKLIKYRYQLNKPNEKIIRILNHNLGIGNYKAEISQSEVLNIDLKNILL